MPPVSLSFENIADFHQFDIHTLDVIRIHQGEAHESEA
jgi:hypothetical protein